MTGIFGRGGQFREVDPSLRHQLAWFLHGLYRLAAGRWALPLAEPRSSHFQPRQMLLVLHLDNQCPTPGLNFHFLNDSHTSPHSLSLVEAHTVIQVGSFRNKKSSGEQMHHLLVTYKENKVHFSHHSAAIPVLP